VDRKTERMDWERASKLRAAEDWDRAELLEVDRAETARTVLVPNRLPQKKKTFQGGPRTVHGLPDLRGFRLIKPNQDGTRRQTLFAGGRLGL
jgi:hypothetical protein